MKKRAIKLMLYLTIPLMFIIMVILLIRAKLYLYLFDDDSAGEEANSILDYYIQLLDSHGI